MKTEPAHVRFKPHQTKLIYEARRLRKAATELRSRVSQGSYGDDELKQFWRLSENAGIILEISNPELGIRAGLGDGYFSSVSRDRRRPKLANFLRALTAIIDVADERLFDIERYEVASQPAHHAAGNEIQSLAKSLASMARYEIERLDAELPNDPDTIASNSKQRELLIIFAEGFERIASALDLPVKEGAKAVNVGKARQVVNEVGSQVTAWWEKNATEVVDWSFRLPFFTAGVAALGWAGANMTVATSAVAAIIGGDKLRKIIKTKV